MEWEVVIGLETHTQLQTNTKIFSGAAIKYGAEPNTQACEVSIALPGVLPVLNKQAVHCAIKFGLAIHAEIAPRSVFASSRQRRSDHTSASGRQKCRV